MGNQELERVWRGRVADAKLRHEFARHFLKEAQEAYPSAESPEHANAIEAESVASDEYFRVLQLFNALVMEGKIPDEDEWRKAG